jgi:hypothetical protein
MKGGRRNLLNLDSCPGDLTAASDPACRIDEPVATALQELFRNRLGNIKYAATYRDDQRILYVAGWETRE